MSTTYTWKVLNLEIIESINELENVISVVRWLITGADDTNTTTVEGTVELDIPTADRFIAYSELTEEQTLTWIKEKLGSVIENRYYLYIDEQLAKMAKPTTIAKDLPWATAPVDPVPVDPVPVDPAPGE